MQYWYYWHLLARASIAALTEALLPLHFNRVKSICFFCWILQLRSLVTCLESSGLASHSCQWCAAACHKRCLADPCDHMHFGVLKVAGFFVGFAGRIRWEDPAIDPDTARFISFPRKWCMMCMWIMWSQSCWTMSFEVGLWGVSWSWLKEDAVACSVWQSWHCLSIRLSSQSTLLHFLRLFSRLSSLVWFHLLDMLTSAQANTGFDSFWPTWHLNFSCRRCPWNLGLCTATHHPNWSS